MHAHPLLTKRGAQVSTSHHHQANARHQLGRIGAPRPAAPVLSASLAAVFAGAITQLAARTLRPAHPLLQTFRDPIAVLQTTRMARRALGPTPAAAQLEQATRTIVDAGLEPVLATLVPTPLFHTIVGTTPVLPGERILEATERWLRKRRPAAAAALTIVARALVTACPATGVLLADTKATHRLLRTLEDRLALAHDLSLRGRLAAGGAVWMPQVIAGLARAVARHAMQQADQVADVERARQADQSAARDERLRLTHEIHLAQRALAAAGGPVADRLAAARAEIATLQTQGQTMQRRLEEANQRAARELRRAEHAEQVATKATAHAATLDREVARLTALLQSTPPDAATARDLALVQAAHNAATQPAREAVLVPMPAPAPAPVLAGERVYVFTAHERAVAREDMRSAFERLGATVVDVYFTKRKDRAPDHFPSDALVVIDVSFMGHADSEYIKHRAQVSGCWVYEGRHGPGMLAQAAAERRQQARARAA